MEKTITAQSALDELNCHQNPRGKSKFNISPCRRKSYQRKYLEEIFPIFGQFRLVVSHIEFRLPKKPPTPKNISKVLKYPQRKLRKEALFVKYDNNKNIRLLSAPIPIKSLPEVKKILRSLIATSIKEGGYSDAWDFFARHCANGISHIKGIYFDQSYSPVAHSDSSRIKIDIEGMHRITARILDVSNVFQNTNVPIHERFCISAPPYYLDWFERSYPNVTLNQDDGTFFSQRMNVIQGKKKSGIQWNRHLDAVVIVIKYKKIKIDHAIYVSHLTVFTDDVFNTTNNETKFTEITRVFEERFEVKFQEGSVLKYLNLLIFQSPLGFSVY